MDIEFGNGVPLTEFCLRFVQGMADRMAMSFFKYGAVQDAFPSKIDAVETLKLCLIKYERTGNSEYLMDVANYAMIEFMHPRHKDAHYTPVDAKASAGRQWVGDVDPSQRPNKIERID